MSTIVCLKEKNQLVLATDSRFMKHDFSGVASDAEQKVFEIAPGTFIATSGWKLVCDFQVEKARELVTKLGTTDVRLLGAALHRETMPCLRELISQLSAVRHLDNSNTISQALSGAVLIHGCVLAGRDANGKLGYFKVVYQLQGDGQIGSAPEEYFGAKRQIFITAGDAAMQVAQDPMIWTARPVFVARRILDALKRASSVIGGPDQIVCLDRSNARWITPPPAGPETVSKMSVATATFTGDVTLKRGSGLPTMVLGNAGMTLYSVDLSTTNPYVSLTNAGLTLYNGQNKLQVTPTSVTVGDFNNSLACVASVIAGSGGGSFALTGTQGDASLNTGGGAGYLYLGPAANPALVTLYGALGYAYLSFNGQQVLTFRQAGPGNTTDTTDVAVRFNNLLSALRTHGLIT